MVNVLHKKFKPSSTQPRYENVLLAPTYFGKQYANKTVCTAHFPVPIETLFRKDKLTITLNFSCRKIRAETSTPASQPDAPGAPLLKECIQNSNPPSQKENETQEIFKQEGEPHEKEMMECEISTWYLLLMPMTSD
jgi:hypothetical protein